jgi:16S rRNA (cytosine967-C5)-methyltransferase
VLAGANFAPFSIAEIGDGRDRALANRLVTVALRRHGQLDLVIRRYLERGIPARSGRFQALLRLSLAQLIFLPDLGDHSAIFLAVEAMRRDTKTQHLSKLANAVLRRAQAEAAEWRLLLPETLFPPAFIESWSSAYGEAVLPAFAEALLHGAPLDLSLVAPDPALVAELGAEPVGHNSYRLETRDRPVEALAGYEDGRFFVQDAAAALPAQLVALEKGARVLDLCAAPGGKTAQLVAAGYRVTALDNDSGRLERLGANMARLRMAPEIVLADGLDYAPQEPFDAVLLDAPCSATGTFRRHPEVIWHRNAGDIDGRAALQRRFIAASATYLKPGGVLVYCVCSLEPREGEDQARWIAETHPELVPDPVRLEELGAFGPALRPDGTVRTTPALPIGTGTADGFFIARYRRTPRS